MKPEVQALLTKARESADAAKLLGEKNYWDFAAIALAFVPRNFGFIMRAVALTKLAVDKRRSKQLHVCSASALDSSTPRGHAARPLAGLFFSHAC